jgi:Flp pilus assembly pilin Flp
MRKILAQFLAKLQQRQDGVAAVEFALITPLLVMLFFGAVEMSNLLIADSRLRNVAGSLSDLITQKNRWNNYGVRSEYGQCCRPADHASAAHIGNKARRSIHNVSPHQHQCCQCHLDTPDCGRYNRKSEGHHSSWPDNACLLGYQLARQSSPAHGLISV